jgi:PRTRC genetic system protein A
MLKLVQHLVLGDDGMLPATSDCLYAYLMAGNGIFLKAGRPGLEVLIPVSKLRIAALPDLIPYVRPSRRIPRHLLQKALEISQQSFPNEIMIWFNLDDQWSMDVPQQAVRPSRAVPLDRHDPRGTQALIDLHSHGSLPPFFSRTDNMDEQSFRIYAVLGEVDGAPRICVRVGVYGNYFNIPASTVFEMPSEIVDVYSMKGDHREGQAKQG